jgi:hypothetical protein
MNLILKLGLAALLIAFLPVPLLAQHGHHGGARTSTHQSESSKAAEAQPSAAERPATKTRRPIPPPGVKGEANSQDVTVNKSKTADKAFSEMDGYIRQ